MARVYYSAYGLSRNTTTSSTYQDQATLTFTPNASKVYAILWGCLLDHNSTTSDARAQLYHDTAAAALQTFNFEMKDSTDNYQIAGAAIYTAPGSPVSQTFSVEFSAEAGTTGCQDAYLIALELDAADFQSVTAAEQTTTSGTYVDIGPSATVGAGDWLLLCSSEIKNSSFDTTNNWEIHDGTSQITVTGGAYLKDSANYTPWWQIVRVSPGSSTTYKLRHKSNGTGSVRSRNTALIALDLSKFSDVIYGDSLGESSTTSSSAQTKLTVTDTPVAADYLQLFAATRRPGSGTASARTDYTRDGAAISVLAERTETSASDRIDHGYGAISTLTTSSTTWLVRYSISDNVTTTTIKNAAIAALALEDAATHYTMTASQGSFTLTGQAVGLTAQRKMTADQASFVLTGYPVDLVYEAGAGGHSGSEWFVRVRRRRN